MEEALRKSGGDIRWRLWSFGWLGVVSWLLLWGGCLPTFPKIECQPCPCGDDAKFACKLPENICVKRGNTQPIATLCGNTHNPPDATPDVQPDGAPDKAPPDVAVRPDTPNPPDNPVAETRPEPQPEQIIPSLTGVRRRCMCDASAGAPACPASNATCTLAGAPIYRAKPPVILGGLADVVVANNGDVFVTDVALHGVWKMDANKKISILTGNGTPGLVNGTLAEARFRSPVGIAMRPNERVLYIAENGNHVIRKIDLDTGMVSTVAGKGEAGMVDAQGDKAAFAGPLSLALGPGVIFVSDTGNHRIRKIDAKGNVTTYAGSTKGLKDGVGTQAAFDGPLGAVLDAKGDLYIVDSGNNLIRKIDPQQKVTTYAGVRWDKGPVTGPKVPLSNISDMALDAKGALCLLHRGDHSVRRFVIASNQMTILAGGGFRSSGGFVDETGKAARFNTPLGIGADAVGNLWVTGPLNRRVRKVTSQGVVSTAMGIGPPGHKEDVGAGVLFGAPRGVVFDGKGGLFVADELGHRIRKIALSSGQSSTLVGTGKPGEPSGGATLFNSPRALAIAPPYDALYVADTNNFAIRLVALPDGKTSTLTGGRARSGYADGTRKDARWGAISAIAIAPNGILYVSDIGNHAIRKVDIAQDKVETIAGPPIGNGRGVAGYQDSPQGSQARFSAPEGLAVSGDILYVADRNNNVIRIVSLVAPYKVSTLAGSVLKKSGRDDGIGVMARFSGPIGLSLRGTSTLYVADSRNNRVRAIDLATKQVTTVIGRGVGYFDGGKDDSKFITVTDVFWHAAQKQLYITDRGNSAIRRLSLP